MTAVFPKCFPRISAACGTFRKLRSTRCGWALLAFALEAHAADAGNASPDAAGPLEEIVVTASLRPEAMQHFPASTTVLDAKTLQAAGVQHFEDVLALVPNLNWSGGTSRPRYFQLRGIGELEQYQGAPNPSVGFLIDGIDLSGVGMPATLFDMGQVEVLRGPQGTRYGANALAGLIKLNTHAPEREPTVRTEATAGDDGTFAAGIVVGGAAGAESSDAAWRLVAQRYLADGFRHNVYLDRDDTNERRESTLRGRFSTNLGSAWRIDASAMLVDLDNGYDVFTIDNSFTTRSDKPGQDAQRTVGGSVVATGQFDRGSLVSTTAYASSDIVYSFDGDWASDRYWAAVAPEWFAQDGPYDYFSRFDRERRTLSEDLRWLSSGTAQNGGFGWVVGLYALDLDEDNRQRDEFESELLRPALTSQYSATNLAAYGEVERRLAPRVVLSGGLRVERRTTDYEDSDGARFNPSDTMLGGHLSLTYEPRENTSYYVTASRGYKAGGFNIGALVPDDRRTFEPEYLWNLETGLKHVDAARRYSLDIAAFYMWREEQQVATSFQLDPGDPLSYVFFTDNAASGRNYGVEATASWRPIGSVQLQATLGWLGTEYLDYHYGDRDLDGREQAHAPSYQYSLSAQWNGARGFMARVDVSGSDAFYFDASHDQRSEPYTLVNLKAGYEHGSWGGYAWARNAFDESYALRGFYFGLEPPDFPDKLYVHRGDPRAYGVTLEWRVR
jgi:outer membrane receptor protein involved in Fe transport